MQDTTCRCDVCGTEKGDTNGWYMLTAYDNAFVVELWGANVRPLREYEHICGQECLHKRLNQWLDNISRPAPVIQEEA